MHSYQHTQHLNFFKNKSFTSTEKKLKRHFSITARLFNVGKTKQTHSWQIKQNEYVRKIETQVRQKIFFFFFLNKLTWSIPAITSSQGRTGARNVVCENSGPTRRASRLCLSASDGFFLFFRTHFQDEICKWAKKEKTQTLACRWKDMTATELKQLIDILLLIEDYKSNHKNFSELWSLMDGRPIFNKIMTSDQFQKIVRVMRFNDAKARLARRSLDTL